MGTGVCEACVTVAAAIKKSPKIVLLMLFGLTILRLLKNISEVPALPPVWGKLPGANIQDAASAELYEPEQLARQIIAKSTVVKRIGFIGLGAMGFGMSTHLLKSNFCVVGYDVYKPTLTRFVNAGGLIGNSPAETSKDVDVLVVMVTNETQAESFLYGDLGAVADMNKGGLQHMNIPLEEEINKEEEASNDFKEEDLGIQASEEEVVETPPEEDEDNNL
ncbi:hypothetical protein DKX38_022317 [Salix brachista]|uniref:6-phosphogluconate dehydrogenase NADP-binding domain-containing protein n=1 Tax=Salix brachista TaxID=2182728 RepID=A0A5N5JZE9_9ROSI|nr:hypothetical protein DKX38_022317 [Salix brachista]